jgi:hypothetical protein
MAIDRDLDGVLDGDEADDGTDPANAGSILGACNDAIDNDGDGDVDGADSACLHPSLNIENPACSDGVDNDGPTPTAAATPTTSSTRRRRSAVWASRWGSCCSPCSRSRGHAVGAPELGTRHSLLRHAPASAGACHFCPRRRTSGGATLGGKSDVAGFTRRVTWRTKRMSCVWKRLRGGSPAWIGRAPVLASARGREEDGREDDPMPTVEIFGLILVALVGASLYSDLRHAKPHAPLSWLHRR